MYRALLALLTTIVLTGCAAFENVPPPTGQDALVYVYRADDVGWYPGGGIVHIYVDGRLVFDLDQATHSYTYVPAGPHQLGMRFVNDDRPEQIAHLSITPVAGQTLYVRCCTFIIGRSDIDVSLGDGLELADHWRGWQEKWRTRLHKPAS